MFFDDWTLSSAVYADCCWRSDLQMFK